MDSMLYCGLKHSKQICDVIAFLYIYELFINSFCDHHYRAQQETSVENKTSPEVNLDPEPAREEQTSIAPSDFFKRITFDRPAR